VAEILGIIFGAIGGFALLLCISTVCLIGYIRYRKYRASRYRDFLRKKGDDLSVQLLNQSQNAQQKEQPFSFNMSKSLFEIDFNSLKDVREIGTGGSGAVVYKAKLGSTQVAIKLFRINMLSSDQDFNKFQHEVELMTHLRHTNVLNFFGACLVEPRIGYVMEYCENGSLDKLIASENLSPQVKRSILLDIARGMEFLHAKRVLHRDLKCGNIMVDKHYVAKVADFDTAVIGGNTKEHIATQAVGTAYYTAPEVILCQDYDEKCDVFSFGMMMHEVLHNKINPYQGEADAMNISFKIAQNPSFRPQISPGIEQWLQELMQRCWAHLSKDRPSFSEIVQIFQQHEQQ
jgi:serine/threonine protein kinase